MGESGENSNTWFRSAIELFEKTNIGWAWWPLKKLGVNNPLQIPTNTNYQKLLKYFKGEGEKPTPDEAFKGLMQLANDSRIDANIYHKDVVDAMFRQVYNGSAIPYVNHNIHKQPLVYAVDFDMGKIGEAFYAIDSANYWVSSGKRVQWNKGWMYRNDAVDIDVCDDTLTKGYKVSALQPTEWLQYTIISDGDSRYNLNIRTTSAQPSSLNVFINNEKKEHALAINTNNNWHTVTLHNIQLKKGINKIRIATISGEVGINYLQFVKPDAEP
jgi:hypothetical protein